MSKVVVLVSGGIDSSVVLGMAAADYDVVVPIHIDYGQQTADIEREMARGQCKNLAGVYPNTRIRRTPVIDYEPVFAHFDEGVADESKTFDHLEEDDGRSSGFVPMRNLHLIATAGAIADQRSAESLMIGMHQDDENEMYPDCSPAFVHAANNAVNESLPPDRTIQVEAPLLRKTKKEILKLGERYGVDWRHTYSCYESVDDKKDPEPCGECPACLERQEAFKDAGLTDPHHSS